MPEPTPASPPAGRDPATASGTRSLRRTRIGVVALLAASGLSGLGDMIAAIALPWFVLQETGSPALTALTGFASLVPLVVGGIVGGAVVDRFGFRPVSVVADLASGATIAFVPILALLGVIEVWHVIVLVFLGSILDIPGVTARQSALPGLAQLAHVRLDRLMAAAETIRRITHLVGPPLAGLLIVLIGPTAVIWLDVVSFAISAALVYGLVPIIRATAEGDVAHWFARVREGFAFLFGDPLLRTLILIIGAVNILMNPIFLVVLPVYANEATGSAADLGLLIGAFGVGSVTSSISYGALADRLSRAAVLRIGLFLTGMPVWVLATVPPVLVALPVMVAIGLSAGAIGPLILTVLGERTPEALRGRVFGTYATLVNGAIPFGVLITGLLLEWMPLGLAVGIIAALYTLVAIASLFARPLRRIELPGVRP
jgi:MFS family permease